MNRTESMFHILRRPVVAGGILSTIVLFSACGGPKTTEQNADTLQPTNPPKPVVREGTNGVEHMPALKSILETFASDASGAWENYNSVPGVKWRNATPVASEGARDAAASYMRGGNIRLTGFGTVNLPDGKTGAEAGSRQDNEGDSGITLLGTGERVESIAIMKFYPSRNYAEILKNQFGSDTTIEPIANACGESDADDPEAREFYRIDMPKAAPVYVETYVDAEGGKYSPGSTTFEFYRNEPIGKIKSMGCVTVGKN